MTFFAVFVNLFFNKFRVTDYEGHIVGVETGNGEIFRINGTGKEIKESNKRQKNIAEDHYDDVSFWQEHFVICRELIFLKRRPRTL